MISSQQKLVRIATYASVATAIALTGIKFTAWCFTDAISLLASLLDSVFDGMSSVVLLLAVRQSQQAATPQYRFGYGKIEALAALGQHVFILLSALVLLYESLSRLRHPAPLTSVVPGIIAMIISMILTAGLILFQRSVIRRTDSVVIRADAMHYLTDFLINAGVLTSLVITHFTGAPWADSVVGACLALYILYALRPLLSESVGILMDRELSLAFRNAIETLASSHPAVRGIHDLRTRASGERKFVQLHLELDGAMSLEAAHAIAEEVEALILSRHPDCDVLIHQDPAEIYQPVPRP